MCLLLNDCINVEQSYNQKVTYRQFTHKTNNDGMDRLVGHVYNTLTRLYKKVFF